MKSSQVLRDEICEMKAKVQAVVELSTAEEREINSDEQSLVDTIHAELPSVEAKLENALKVEAIVASKMTPEKLDNRKEEKQDRRLTVPLKFARSKAPEGFGSVENAYNAGQWILAAFCGNRKSKQYCQENGLRIRNAMTTGDNTKGGFLVPEPLESAIIELRESFGVFAQYAQQWTMTDAVQQVPKLNGEITSYYVGENTQITPSDMAFALVRLEAKKLAAVGVVSSELNEDAVLSVADAYARSVAYKFSYDEDNAGFNGDGTGNYGGIVGCENALLAGSVVTATAQTTVSALTLATAFEPAIGKLPEYAGIQPAWYFHKNVWALGPQRLLDAVGGNSMADVAMGAPKTFLGYPVRFSQVLRSSPTSGQIYGYFGDLRMASILGRRRGMSMASDNSIYFLQDATAIRATQRYDINVHDRGTASAAGALLALKLA